MVGEGRTGRGCRGDKAREQECHPRDRLLSFHEEPLIVFVFGADRSISSVIHTSFLAPS